MKTFLTLVFLILTVSVSSATEEVTIGDAKAACDKDVGKSCFMIGVIYQHGLGVDKDLERAKIYFKKACDLDIPASCGVLKTLDN
ncbi:tetratricopeptide repeat protein [Kiloniella majae]|uniref:tetratricopeptide repeat protein n=1 Tax=Kiloniella majae TaxID=1938558 RepID=UPI000A278A7C|nr:SEL1-like repeat protein [Kiloniella majae]